jgi:hypothetical protein
MIADVAHTKGKLEHEVLGKCARTLRRARNDRVGANSEIRRPGKSAGTQESSPEARDLLQHETSGTL